MELGSIIFLAVLVVVVGYFIVIYNNLVRTDNLTLENG